MDESIKRLQNRGRAGENGLEYFKTLAKTYKEEILEVYPNIKVITRETLLREDQLNEVLLKFINEEEININLRSYLLRDATN